jgi:hypothetical protein
MPPAALDLSAISLQRDELALAQADAARRSAQIAALQAQRDQLARLGAADRIAEVDANLLQLRKEHQELHGRIGAQIDDIARLSDGFVIERDPSPLVEGLDGKIPVFLLPVRLETRFFNHNTELRIRIFPDDVHIDRHEPALTEAEEQGGKWYWTERWKAGSDTARASAVWTQFSKRFQPARCAWIAKALTPKNLDQLGSAAAPAFPEVTRKSGAWTRAARAVALPDRWVAVGYAKGEEVFRVWSGHVPDFLPVVPSPDAAAPDDSTAPQDSLPIDPEMRWVVDYDEAVKKGMAVAVTDAQLKQGHRLAEGLERLVVLGVDWTVPPDRTSQALSSLFQAHQYTDGMAFLALGTPTNNTRDAGAGNTTDTTAQAGALDPARARPAVDRSSGSRSFATALGLSSEDTRFDAVAGASTRESQTAGDLLGALWESTMGYYLDTLWEPAISNEDLALARDHVVRFLRPSGPFPPLRIGKQPYGILPIVPAARFKPQPDSPFESQLHSLLTKMRAIWHWGVRSIPRMADLDVPGRTDKSKPEDVLLEILQQGPVAQHARFRRILGLLLVEATEGMGQHQRIQANTNILVALALGLRRGGKVMETTADPQDYKLPVPWVQAGEAAPGAALAPNYIGAIAELLKRPDNWTQLSAMLDADTLLQSLLAQAAINEMNRAHSRLAERAARNIATDVVFESKPLLTPEFLNFQTTSAVRALSDGSSEVTLSTPGQLAQVVIPKVTGQLTLSAYVAQLLSQPEKPQDVQSLAAFMSRLQALSKRPVHELEWAFRSMLDVASYRLDAWLTSLATRRLQTVQQPAPSGVYMGGYGWVEDLKPDTIPTSLGYIHVPSLDHAATAAVLRSGHLAHKDDEHDVLNIDLRSDRVRVALRLLDGVAQGQPLAALLGYRFERALRERDILLARFIFPIRLLAPLRPATAPESNEPLESIAARDVVDGVKLLERWRNEGRALLSGLQANDAEKDSIEAELARVDDAFDAVSDVLMSEKVFQTVRGNLERAAAAMDMPDRQARPEPPHVVRTPRSGLSYQQHVLVLSSDSGLPAPWQSVALDVRASTEPHLNAWLAHLLGDPARVRFAARVLVKEQADKPPVEKQKLELGLPQLNLSPLSLVLLSASGGQQQVSELHERLAQALAAQAAPQDAEATLQLLDAPPEGSGPDVIGLSAFESLLSMLHELITRARAADARDVSLPAADSDLGLQVDELAQRANAAVKAIDEALHQLDAVLSATPLQLGALSTALEQASRAGARGAVPKSVAPGSSAAGDPHVLDSLRVQCRSVRAALSAVRKRVAAMDEAFAKRPGANAAEAVTHHTERVRAIFGKEFPVLPLFAVASAAAQELTASSSQQAALCNEDTLAATGWLQQMAVVRPDVGRLAAALSAAELTGVALDAAAFTVAQLPHESGKHWAALPFRDNRPTKVRMALVTHALHAVDWSKPLAGLMCDAWVESVPSSTETTGVTFHYDSPGARAPQSILLAVPGEQPPHWSLDALLDTVLEAADLARLRLVTPQSVGWLGSLLPMVYLPQGFRKDIPSIPLYRMHERYAAKPGGQVLGKV